MPAVNRPTIPGLVLISLFAVLDAQASVSYCLPPETAQRLTSSVASCQPLEPEAVLCRIDDIQVSVHRLDFSLVCGRKPLLVRGDHPQEAGSPLVEGRAIDLRPLGLDEVSPTERRLLQCVAEHWQPSWWESCAAPPEVEDDRDGFTGTGGLPGSRYSLYHLDAECSQYMGVTCRPYEPTFAPVSTGFALLSWSVVVLLLASMLIIYVVEIMRGRK